VKFPSFLSISIKGVSLMILRLKIGRKFWYNSDMELSERWIQKFESEGFANIFEWDDPAGTVYPAHKHQGKVSLFVTDGSITFDFAGVSREIKAGERFDVPVGEEHAAVVGPDGWIVIVGEE